MGGILQLLAGAVQGIFSLIKKIIILIVDLANYPFFDIEIIKEFANKVFMVIGILMLFKLVVSAIQYIVNPDMFDDKNKGLASILKRTVIAVVFLAFVRPAFELAIDIQKDLVAQIPVIIFGGQGKTITEMGDVGDNVSISIVNGFIEAREGKNPKVKGVTNVESIKAVLSDGCGTVFDDFDGAKCSFKPFKWLLTVPIGIFLIYILVSMAVDVAIRTLKLGIVQIFAPIPIVSYVTDEKKTQTWLKTTMEVYADLFIRMGVIYFVVYFIDIIMKGMTNVKYEGTTDFIFIQIFIIIGLLLFAKKAPKFICDLLGFQAAGEGIGDMFKRAGGMFGATLGTGRALLASGINSRSEIRKKAGVGTEEWKNLGKREQRDRIKKAAKEYGRGRRVAQVFGSTGAALRNGMFESIAHTKGYKDVMASSRTAAERSYDMNKAMHDNGVNRFAYQKELINRRLGIVSDLDVMNAEIEAAKNASDKSKAALDYVHNNMSVKFGGVKFTDAMMNDSKFLSKLQIEPGKSEYDFSGGLKIDLRQMGKSGKSTIAGIMNDLTNVIENKNGVYSGDDRAIASRLLDKLQGEADKYLVNMTKEIEAFKSGFSTQAEYENAFVNSEYSSLGFDRETNPAFGRLVQEALEGNIIHSTDTQFGRAVFAEAKSKGIIDDTGKVKPERVGDWLSLNKSRGQTAQTENIAAKGTQGAAATVKSIADKYDKKK